MSHLEQHGNLVYQHLGTDVNAGAQMHAVATTNTQPNVLCKMEGSDIWVLGDIITIDGEQQVVHTTAPIEHHDGSTILTASSGVTTTMLEDQEQQHVVLDQAAAEALQAGDQDHEGVEEKFVTSTPHIRVQYVTADNNIKRVVSTPPTRPVFHVKAAKRPPLKRPGETILVNSIRGFGAAPSSASRISNAVKRTDELLRQSGSVATAHVVTVQQPKRLSEGGHGPRQPMAFCDECGRGFTAHFHLRRHMRIHTGERPFSCSICDASFRHKTTLIVHERRHTGEKPFACRYCGKKFADPANWRVHEHSHSQQRTHTCNVCQKSFNASSTLYAHMKIHSGERNYVCPHCNRSFTFNTTLLRHIRTHTGEKPYNCEQCDKQFATASNLSSHRKKHLREQERSLRRFTCQLCTVEFKNKAEMRLHMKKNHFTATCEQCAETFRSTAALRMHMRTRHMVDSSDLAMCASAMGVRDMPLVVMDPLSDIYGDSDEEELVDADLLAEAQEDGTIQYRCDECDAIFETASAAVDHKKTDHRYAGVCDVCHREFNTPALLDAHKRTHNISKGTSAVVVCINGKG